jgi:hypothetical protein
MIGTEQMRAELKKCKATVSGCLEADDIRRQIELWKAQ